MSLRLTLPCLLLAAVGCPSAHLVDERPSPDVGGGPVVPEANPVPDATGPVGPPQVDVTPDAGVLRPDASLVDGAGWLNEDVYVVPLDRRGLLVPDWRPTCEGLGVSRFEAFFGTSAGCCMVAERATVEVGWGVVEQALGCMYGLGEVQARLGDGPSEALEDGGMDVLARLAVHLRAHLEKAPPEADQVGIGIDGECEPHRIVVEDSADPPRNRTVLVCPELLEPVPDWFADAEALVYELAGVDFDVCRGGFRSRVAEVRKCTILLGTGSVGRPAR